MNHSTGIQEVGPAPRRGAPAAGAEHDARPALLPQLRPDLVRLHAAGGRPHQDQVVGALARPHQGPGAALQLQVSQSLTLAMNSVLNTDGVLIN